MAKRLTWCISAAAVLAWAPGAFAQNQIWSAGATGIADEADQGIVRFDSAGTASIRRLVPRGTLNLRFPVQTLQNLLIPQQGDCPELRVNLRDTGPGARVLVRLIALGIFPGFPRTPEATVLGEVDSDTRPPEGDPNLYRSYSACIANLPPGSEFLIDYAFFAYYVDVQLIKTAASANPGLMSVQICPAQDACDP